MRPSIGRRLLISLISSLTVLWLGAVIAVSWVLHYETEEIFDSSLQEMSQRILALAMQELNISKTNARQETLGPMPHDEYLTYQLLNRNRELLMRSHIAPAQAYPVPMQAGHYKVGRQRFYVETSRDGNFVIQVAERTNHREDTFYHLLSYLLIPFALLLPIATLIIYRSAKNVQSTIIQFGNDISTRDSKDLRPLATDSLPIELLSLGESINSLMYRLQLALEVERNFTANSAHELRTPIAAALAQLDVLREIVSDPKTEARVADARNMIDRLEKMTVKLLQLAKAESGTAFNLSKIDLNSISTMLVRDLSFRSLRELAFTHPNDPVWIKGDVDAIGIVIQNLIENADRYASAESPLEIEITSGGAMSIRNDCEAISADDVKNLRNRFVCLNQTKGGSGLGLSIVDTILGQCEAELIITSPCYANGRGFEASVNFNPA